MIYKFKKVEINTNSRTITVDKKHQKVQPKVYELIIFLLENRQRALSKEAIQNAIWTDVEVSETAMTRAIMKARKLLLDSGDVIKTVHGHGYHFIAEVTTLNSDNATEAQSNTSKKLLFYGLILLLMAALFFFVMQFKKVSMGTSEITVAVLPITDQTNDPDLAWASLGLMSLSTQMIQADNSVATTSSWKTAKIDTSPIDDGLTLTASQLEGFTTQLESTHLILAKLSLDQQGLYKLTHTVYHPNGRSEYDAIYGDNPTAMVQKMTKQFLSALPGRSTNTPYRSISNDVFTNELYSRGMGFQIMGDAKKAREYFQLAANEDASLFWPRYELALTTRKLGLAKESEQELLQLKAELPQLTNEPSAAIVLANALGSAKMRQGENQAAIEYYKEGFASAVEHNRYDYQTIMAGNVGLIYKRMRHFEKAKSWIAKSIEIHEHQGIELTGYTNLLLGQVESQQGNNQAAIQQFNQAITIFQQTGAQRFFASALAEKAKIMKRQGYWNNALQLIQQANQIKTKMSDRLAIISGMNALMELYIESGQYADAEALVAPITKSVKEINNQTHEKYLLRSQALLAYHMGNYQQALIHLNELTEKQKNSETREIELKINWINGNTSPMTQWLDDFRLHTNNEKTKARNNLTATRLKRFIAEQTTDSKLDALLKIEITQSNELGLTALATEAQLKLADLYINNNNWEAVEELLNLMSLKKQNWWQIKLLESQFLLYQGQLDDAKTKAEEAKSSSTESWSGNHQQIYLSVISCCVN